jgi:hypothetical protein
MNYKVVGSLFNMILFIIFASSYSYRYIKRMGVRDEDTSLIVRSILVGLVSYLSMNMNY